MKRSFKRTQKKNKQNTTITNNRKDNRKTRNKRTEIKEKIEANAITNLSDHILTREETELLNKGLSYTPSYNQNQTQIEENINEFIRSLYTDYHFKDKAYKPKPLYTKNREWNPPITNNPHLLEFTRSIQTETPHYTLITNTDIETQENRAIRSLKNNKNIVIKKS